MSGYVYVLELANGNYYIGSTRNIEEMMQRHQRGGVSSTKKYLPITVKWCRMYDTYVQAYTIERYLKRSKNRAFIESFFEE